jgi:3-methyladenine DNA glycosylase AlkD
MVKNKYHQDLIKLFEKNKNIQNNNGWVKKYLGTSKNYYNLKTGDKKKLIKDYLKAKDFSFEDFKELLLSLSQGDSFEELSSMGAMLEFYPKYRNKLETKIVDKLFDNVEGWAEVDTTCVFTPEDLLANWPEWEKLLNDFNIDKNIHKRRASLVLFTLPLRKSAESKFYKLALKNVEKLKTEKDVLITKAISWVLRSMILTNPEVVREYLEKNKDSLPRIALREATTKLLTGKKYINKKNKL